MIYEIYTENGTKKKRALTGNGYGLPLGSIIAVYSNLVPDGYLPCNGAVYDTTTYAALYAYLGSNRLPDLRECNLVGAGQSSNDYDASTNPNGIHEHDVYVVGEFKDDQLQNITATFRNGCVDNALDKALRNLTGALKTDGTLPKTTYPSVAPASIGSYYNDEQVKFDASLVARTGTTTHGKQVGVNYCIKATPAYVEPDTVSDMVNTLRTQDSYSTEEVNTGKKWIDGKPIYRIAVEDTANVTQSQPSAISASAYTILSSKNIDRVITANWIRPASGRYNAFSTSVSIEITSSAILKAGSPGNGYAGAYLTLEYTKTTD